MGSSERIEEYKGFEIRKTYNSESYSACRTKPHKILPSIYAAIYRLQDIKERIDKFIEEEKQEAKKK